MSLQSFFCSSFAATSPPRRSANLCKKQVLPARPTLPHLAYGGKAASMATENSSDNRVLEFAGSQEVSLEGKVNWPSRQPRNATD